MDSTCNPSVTCCLGNGVDTSCEAADSEARSDGKAMSGVALSKKI